MQSRLLMVEGKLQKEGEVIHVIVKRCFNISKLLKRLVSNQKEDLMLTPLSRADERSAVVPNRERGKEREIVQGKIFPEGRNFK